jgi:hypothetical protein
MAALFEVMAFKILTRPLPGLSQASATHDTIVERPAKKGVTASLL